MSGTTSAFIDLATFDLLEAFMYGGEMATAYFVRETRKATWFSLVPVQLSRASGTADFNQTWSATISRSGDYLCSTWLRATFPEVTCSTADRSIRWCKNLMHNLVKECSISFNDMVAARFDSYHLDFWAAFTVPAGKQNGYNNMIGNIPALTNRSLTGSAISAATLNLPIPLFYSRDSGVALPTAALPYNDMKINLEFRNWTDLLIFENTSPAVVEGLQYLTPTLSDLNELAVNLSNVGVWAEYAVVSNDERKRMGCAPRDILIEQVQTAPRTTFTPSTARTLGVDLRFSHAIKAVFFGARNTTATAERSNYSCCSAVPGTSAVPLFPGANAVDPIEWTSLIYESTERLKQMGSDYYSLVNPYYHAPVIPTEVGYHLYSYALEFANVDPTGSTNYGKLTNVSLTVYGSGQSVNVTQGNTTGHNTATQTFEFVCTVLNNNILRISGGAAGFPVL